MKPSPTYIHYRVQWQILGPQSPGQRFERERFQRFFEALNANRQFRGYDDFSYRTDRCELVKNRGTAQDGAKSFSKVVYADDALLIEEEWTDESTLDFVQKLKVVLDGWFKGFPETLAVVQTCSVRALMVPTHSPDSRQFLGDVVLRLQDGLKSSLQGQLLKVGVTLGCQRMQGTTPMNLECAASSWRDNRSVWIEVRALAPLAQPLNAATHDQAEAIFGRCVDFLEKEVIPFLVYYDRKNPDAEGGNAT